jgi:hypothetical protein
MNMFSTIQTVSQPSRQSGTHSAVLPSGSEPRLELSGEQRRQQEADRLFEARLKWFLELARMA